MMDPRELINRLTQTLNDICDGKNPMPLNVDLKHDCECGNEMQALTMATERLRQLHETGYHAMTDMANGNLEGSLPPDAPLFVPLKTLKSRLKHLIWQANRLTDNDHTQNVDNLGEFSATFNRLRESLMSRKQIEEQLAQSNARYNMMTSAITDVIWSIDIHTGRFTHVTASVQSLLGITEDEAMEQTLMEMIDDQSKLTLYHLIADATQSPIIEGNHHVGTYLSQVSHKNGRIIDVETNVSLLVDSAGKAVELLGVSRDVTERKSMELALKESEANLEKLLARQTLSNRILTNQLKYVYNNSINGIAFFDIDGDTIRFANCNPKWARALDKTPDELKGLDISVIQDPDTESLYRKTIERGIQAKTPIQDYVKWRGMDLQFILIPIIDDHNRIEQCAAMVYNITEQFQSQLRARESEEKFAQIFNHSTDPIALTDLNMNIISANQRFFDIAGVSPNELGTEGLNVARFLLPKYHQRLQVQVEAILRGDKVAPFECEGRMADNRIIPFEVSATSYQHKGETVMLAVVHDLSERKRHERQMTQISTRVETMERRKLAADLHDNVGPLLSSMNMYLSLLTRKPEVVPLIDTIENVRRILKETITSVREISNNINPQILAKYGLTAALNLFFETKRNLIDIETTGNLGDFRFDETKEITAYNVIKEAFNNTLKYANATKINLSIEKTDTALFVAYRDNGIGFDYDEATANATLSMGLFSIVNRIRAIDGDHQIITSPNNGFILEFSFLYQIL